MRKLIAFLSLLLVLPLLPARVFAADTKVTALTADASPTTDDLIMTVDDVSGTPTSKKVTLANLSKVCVPTNLTSNAIDAANSVWAESNAIAMEGATADAFEGRFSPTDPTADRTWTLPNQTGVVCLTDSSPTVLTPGAAITLTVAPGNRVYTLTPTDDQDGTITFSGAGAAGDITTIIFTTTGTADEIITFHATLCSSTGTLTLGTTASHYMTASFISDGSKWHELSRTADQT